MIVYEMSGRFFANLGGTTGVKLLSHFPGKGNCYIRNKMQFGFAP